MASPLALIHCDASGAIGGGHAYRCAALGARLKEAGWRLRVVAPERALQAVGALADLDPTPLIVPEGSRGTLLAEYIAPLDADLLIVDRYDLDIHDEAACRPKVRRLLAIDDLCRPHTADWVLDPTPNRLPEDLPQGDGIALTGAAYALLRPTFLKQRREALARREGALSAPPRLLIALGATDPDNMTAHVLRSLQGLKRPLTVDVLLGGSAPHRETVIALCSDTGATLHLDIADPAPLLTTADIAIGAGGGSLAERGCLGLPSILLVLAENQRDNAQAAAKMAVARVTEPDALPHALANLLDNDQDRRAMAKAGAHTWDGRGTDRVLLALAGAITARDGSRVTLRLATLDDDVQLHRWQCQPETRRFARSPEIPSWEGHLQWLRNVTCNPDRLLTVIEADGRPVGSLRLDRLPARSGTEGYGADVTAWEVSIYLDSTCHGRGLGLATLALADRVVPGAILLAESHPDNAASQNLFQAAGYSRLGPSQFRRNTAPTVFQEHGR